MRRFAVLLAPLALLALSSCPNVFDPLDSPKGDKQLLSAARAAFDKGDLARARELYGKLGDNDDALAELAFVALEEVGLGITPLAIAISKGNDNGVGGILTNLVEAAAPKSGTAARQSVANAYRAVARIRSTELKGFVRFVTSFILAAQLLSEHGLIRADYSFERADIAASGCAVGTCVASCGNPTSGGITLTAGDEDADFVTDPANATMGGVASWEKFHLALSAAAQGLTEMEIDSGSSLSLLNQIVALGNPTVSVNCYRGGLLNIPGVGR